MALSQRAEPKPDYGDPEAEYRAAREGAAWTEQPADLLEVRGPDRLKFLQGLLTQDLKGMEPGEARPAALLDAKARVLTLPLVLELGDRYGLELPLGHAKPTLAYLRRYLVSEAVELEDVGAAWARFLLLGPRAAEPPGAARAVRDARCGVPGLVLWSPAERGPALAEALAARARPIGARALEALRIEAGLPLCGREVHPSTLFPELGLEDRVSHMKGCYLGQEIVARVKHRGQVQRRLAGLRLSGEAVPDAGAPVRSGETEVGKVSSAAWSWGLGAPVALAFLRSESAEPGTRLSVLSGGRTLSAEAAPLPFPRP